MATQTTTTTKPNETKPAAVADAKGGAVAPVDKASIDRNSVDGIKYGLEQMRPQFSAGLPSHIPVERFERVVLTAANVNPDLVKADRRSFFNACLRAAQDGLLPDGREAALVIFNTKVKRDDKEVWISAVQYMPMVYGIVKKVRQSGDVVEFRSRVVYEKDKFAYVLGDDERIEHEPFMAGDADKPIAVYAIAKGKDGWVEREVMTYAEVEKVRAVSKSKDKGPWVSWWGEMARKTVMRRLSKRLPVSAEIMQTFEADDDLAQPEGYLPPARPQLSDFGGDRTIDQEEGGQQNEAATKPYEAVDAYGEVHPFPTAREAAEFVLAELDGRPDAIQAISEHNADLVARFEEEGAADQAHAIRHWLARWQQNQPQNGETGKRAETGKAATGGEGDADADPVILPLPAVDGNRNGWLKAVQAQIGDADTDTLDKIVGAIDAIEDMPPVLQAELTKAIRARRDKLSKPGKGA